MNPQRLHERFADSVRMNALLDPRTHAAKTRFCCHLAQGVALSVERMISSSHGLALRVNTRTPLQLDRCRRSKGRTRKPTPGSNSKGSGVHIERLILIAPLPLAHMYASAPTDPYESRNLAGS